MLSLSLSLSLVVAQVCIGFPMVPAIAHETPALPSCSSAGLYWNSRLSIQPGGDPGIHWIEGDMQLWRNGTIFQYRYSQVDSHIAATTS